MSALPPAGEWARAVAHSLAHPRHIMGPYEGAGGAVHIGCEAPGCGFATGPGDAGAVLAARCDKCQMPAVLVRGIWQHSEAADAVFCAVLYPAPRGVGSGGSE